MKSFFLLLTTLLTAALLTGCRTCKPAVVESVSHIHHTDTTERVCWRLDSVVIHDSITTEKRGDTVYIDRTRTRTRTQVRVDTVNRLQTRIEYRTQTKVQQVDRPLRWWQKVLMWGGAAALALAAALVGLRLKK